MTLKKTYRLNIQDFKTADASARSLKTPCFVFRDAPNGFSYNRYGVSISKRVDKTAVGRNRAKRRIQTILQQLNARIKPGYDMLFIVRKSFKGDPKQPISDITMLLQHANLL